MSGRALFISFAREVKNLRVSLSPGDGAETTLRHYEIHPVDWTQVEKVSLELSALLGRSTRGLTPTTESLQRLKRSGQVLFDLLVPPDTKEKLAETTAQALILDIGDDLVHLPWELLYNGREFLCRRFSLGRRTSTRQAFTSRSSRSLKAPYKILVLADPKGDLRAAYCEGLEIKNFLDQRSDLFEVDFKSCPVDISFAKKNLRDYDIVHYAGHAVYHSDHPANSGWLFSDGALTAAEVAAMGGFRPMPALVFANGCRSGQTEDWTTQDEYASQVFGLANAYLLAGVRHYVGTLVDVLDRPSCQFAKGFYGALAGGASIGEALRSARADTGRTYGEEAIIWANYVLYGDPSIALASPPTERVTEVSSSETVVPDWRGATRGSGAASPIVPNVTRPLWPCGLGAVLVLLIAVASVISSRFFHWGSERTRSVAISDLASIGAAAVPTSVDAAIAPLTLSMNVIGQRKELDGSYSELVVSEGSVLRSYDNFQIHIEVNRPAHTYVLIFDSEGKASQLFPDPKLEQVGYFEAGRRNAVPAKDLWFWLDENRGTETIYVLASEKPLTQVQNLLHKMEGAGESSKKRLSQEIQENIRIVQRGVGGIGKGKPMTYTLSDGRRIQKVTDVVTGTGAVVRAISFRHE